MLTGAVPGSKPPSHEEVTATKWGHSAPSSRLFPVRPLAAFAVGSEDAAGRMTLHNVRVVPASSEPPRSGPTFQKVLAAWGLGPERAVGTWDTCGPGR